MFLVAGSLKPGLGGAILAHNTDLPDLERRVGEDPFVAENVVSAEILEITPSKADIGAVNRAYSFHIENENLVNALEIENGLRP